MGVAPRRPFRATPADVKGVVSYRRRDAALPSLDASASQAGNHARRAPRGFGCAASIRDQRVFLSLGSTREKRERRRDLWSSARRACSFKKEEKNGPSLLSLAGSAIDGMRALIMVDPTEKAWVYAPSPAAPQNARDFLLVAPPALSALSKTARRKHSLASRKGRSIRGAKSRGRDTSSRALRRPAKISRNAPTPKPVRQTRQPRQPPRPGTEKRTPGPGGGFLRRERLNPAGVSTYLTAFFPLQKTTGQPRQQQAPRQPQQQEHPQMRYMPSSLPEFATFICVCLFRGGIGSCRKRVAARA